MKTQRLGWLGLMLVGLSVAACGSDASQDSEASGGDFASEYDRNNPGNTGAGGSVTSSPNQGAAAGTSGGYVPGAGGSAAPPYGTGGGAGTGQQGEAPDESGASGQGGDAGTAGATCKGVDLTKPTTLYVSSDDSNSMASAALVRKLIRSGQTPSPYLVRPYEMLNYYNVAYVPPAPGTLRLVPQMKPGKNAGEYDLQIGVQAPLPESRRAVNLTLVLDTSGSMQGTPIQLQKESVRAIASQLRAGDIISVTTWSTTTNIALSGHVVQGPNDPTLLAVNDTLDANGGTDLHQGLVNGYDLAKLHYSEDRINRVVVISDGVANVGLTDEQMIGKEADIENKEGIYLVGVGVGEGVNDTLLNVVTDAGNGAYLYLDSPEEAQKMLATRFDEVMEIAARNVQVSMTVPSYFSIVKFSGEQYSTDPTKVKPQHLAPGDAMVISQTIRACDPSLVLAADAVSFKATWTEPGTWAPRNVEVSSTVGELQAQGNAELLRGQAIVAYADALKKGQSCAQRKPLVADALAAADAADPGKSDAALVEIRELLSTFGSGCN